MAKRKTTTRRAKKRNRKKGQSMVEYAILTLFVVLGFFVFYEMVLKKQLFTRHYNRIVDVVCLPVP